MGALPNGRRRNTHLHLGLVACFAVLLRFSAAGAQPMDAPLSPGDRPAHARPFFMPPAERHRLRALVEQEPWAQLEYRRVQEAAARGDGFWSAFLYALTADRKYLPAARRALLERYDAKAYWVRTYAEHLRDTNYFKAGQPGIPDVYYDVDVQGPVMFDWVYNGLEPAPRASIADGLRIWAHYRIRCMDRWTQTPNLVLKPTFLVAMIGLTLQDPELIAWGLHRTKPWGGARGGYDVVLATMLKDGGPWHEAPIYPVAHQGLWITAILSRYRQFSDGRDWFHQPAPGGGSPQGLFDYYIDSAYPIEHSSGGDQLPRVRVANYGDGSTNSMSDLFLVHPAARPTDHVLHEPLTAAYNAAGDPRYAAFLSLLPAYRPDLWNRRPLPPRADLPPAPSTVWPTYGLAMLRSDESPAYWTSGKAIAVFQLMSQGYGHDHRDKFSITLHGANRLFYPNYNAIQYENPAIGWTRNSVSHNTLVVDEEDTRDVAHRAIRHAFSPDAKFLATAEGVFAGVAQTRALLLTREYLLDVFQAASAVPQTYDYLLHSFGRPELAAPARLQPTDALRRRYGLVDNQRGFRTSEPWSVDFVIPDGDAAGAGPGSQHHPGAAAKLRLSMAAAPATLLVLGTWGERLARLVAEQQPGATLDRLTMLATRRRARATVFVATHEPYRGGATPGITAVTVLGQTTESVLVRVTARDFTDYAAVRLGAPGRWEGEDATVAVAPGLGSPAGSFIFRTFGYLRVRLDGSVLGRGDWRAFALPDARGPLTLNGQPASAEQHGRLLVFGKPAAPPQDLIARSPAPLECPVPVGLSPPTLRGFPSDRRPLVVTIRNTLAAPLTGRLAFAFPEGMTTEPAASHFGPIEPGGTAQVTLTVVSHGTARGRHQVPYRLFYRAPPDGKEVATAAEALPVMVGPTLERLYQHPKPAVYVLHAPRLTAQFAMFDGLCRSLADDAGVERLADTPLFTLSDGKSELLGPATRHAFTWPVESPAELTAHADDRCRWQMVPVGDRLLFRMDRGGRNLSGRQ